MELGGGGAHARTHPRPRQPTTTGRGAWSGTTPMWPRVPPVPTPLPGHHPRHGGQRMAHLRMWQHALHGHARMGPAGGGGGGTRAPRGQGGPSGSARSRRRAQGGTPPNPRCPRGAREPRADDPGRMALSGPRRLARCSAGRGTPTTAAEQGASSAPADAHRASVLSPRSRRRRRACPGLSSARSMSLRGDERAERLARCPRGAGCCDPPLMAADVPPLALRLALTALEKERPR